MHSERLAKSSGVGHWSFLDWYPAVRWTGSSAGLKMLLSQSPITFYLTTTSSARRPWSKLWLRWWVNFRLVI